MYYLRKEPYEQIIPEIKKTDGTVIPKRKHMTDDRALYKANNMSRFYRGEYPKPHQKGMKLYQVKKLDTILRQRENLYNYCGEWFDVYNEKGKVDISNVVKCKKSMLIDKCDGDGFTIPNKYITVKESSFWNIEEDSFRVVGGEIRLTNDGLAWLEIPKESFEESFERINY